MELLIIRHGQSQAELEERHEGRADFLLTELGRFQARQAAAFIYAKYPLQHVISSPLKRAFETAEIIAKPLALEVHTDARLMERDNGKLAGMLRSEALDKYPYPAEGRRTYEKFQGGESDIEFRSRVENFFSELCHHPPAHRVGIIAHGGSINMLFRAFMNLPMDVNIYLGTGDTGIHFWHLSERYRQILFSNYLGHLQDKPTQ
ncbi:histidine phosphatase family protein [bacterium (Candidatus Blackallbacteria) CG17_big_fil_post_rev_8_21_14_2_50_48_46]|uniref:Histidine phosphatase family protein n=1 Tax=bacterium (Candidatus Blackallbacteria) CG17_big_fil_post_rev_8_21_14_2_50_48_46 TaxID=2014261 RepID=A0A2M7G1E8_9BACT|nr:MAG: histidine phosphatase family protein [bacterium (Candidatus Blackallbacteria) CG18_big_fil_WC_8_21_14_2_50_49_26]PIW15500.1 MAG: histidine phosphatase family protein [bacterium (Candidatus Blackallbacteria) CG17_big_fil_post_rev_8_21_14_2_50_48_46]PIW48600.1 MAG: histidine phosphatase family protein [bacterium (Candidatus Blackallbacteria) CG13_big_fil_rev_8_21_14_2_50_49_14]